MSIYPITKEKSVGGKVHFGNGGEDSHEVRASGHLLVDPAIFGDERQADGTLCLHYCSAAFAILTAQIYEGSLNTKSSGFEESFGRMVSEIAESVRKATIHKREMNQTVRPSQNMTYSEGRSLIESVASVHGPIMISEDLSGGVSGEFKGLRTLSDSEGETYDVTGLSRAEIAHKMAENGFISVVAYGVHARLVIGTAGKDELALWDPISGFNRVSTAQEMDIIIMGKSLKSISGDQSIKHNPPGDIQWG